MLCLKVPTDAAWATAALRDVDAVLVDHAHCEMKAASNALSMATRHLADVELVRAMTDLAREEIDHFQQVLALLVARGVPLGPPPVDEYAAELRRRTSGTHRGQGDAAAVVDRLLVAALIEARSCERFKLLAEAAAPLPEHAALHAFWTELLAAEARHYRTFVDLAERAAGGDRAAVLARLELLAGVEGALVRELARRGEGASRATIHG
jgi:tRNA 2-(methylsulfanyl)-N6-isopentenyladenosine37 hydroxylase